MTSQTSLNPKPASAKTPVEHLARERRTPPTGRALAIWRGVSSLLEVLLVQGQPLLLASSVAAGSRSRRSPRARGAAPGRPARRPDARRAPPARRRRRGGQPREPLGAGRRAAGRSRRARPPSPRASRGPRGCRAPAARATARRPRRSGGGAGPRRRPPSAAASSRQVTRSSTGCVLGGRGELGEVAPERVVHHVHHLHVDRPLRGGGLPGSRSWVGQPCVGGGAHDGSPSGGFGVGGGWTSHADRRAGSRLGSGSTTVISARTVGRARSSQAGIHQFQRPSSVIVAGTSTIRTTVASRVMATAMPDAELLDHDVDLDGEAEEDGDHDRRGRGDDPAGRGEAADHAAVRVPGVQPVLADPREQEDLVVHRQAEQDREQQDRASSSTPASRGRGRAAPRPSPTGRRRSARRTPPPIDSRFIAAALTGTTTERNTIPSSSTETPTTNPTTTHSRCGEHVGDVGEQRRGAGDLDARRVPSARRSSTRSRVRSSVGPKVGSASKIAQCTVRSRTCTGDTAAMSSRAATLRARRSTSASSSRLGVGHEQHRPVGARTELLGDQVVGLAGGQVGRLAAEESCGQVRMASAGAARASSTTSRRPAPRPAGRRPTRVAQRCHQRRPPVRSRPRPDPAREQPVTGQAAQRRDQGERGERRRRRPRWRWRSRRSRRSAARASLQPEQRDQHGRGGEDHRAPGGGDGATGRLVLVVARAEELHEAGDQQQGVVDAHAEADHGGHHRCRGADVHGRRPAG